MASIVAITADLHLAQRAWTRHPGLEGDSYYGLQQIVDYCLKNELELIMAGDVFDKTRPDPGTIWHTRKQLERMHDKYLGVYAIQGQHELDRKAPWLLSLSSWTKHIHRQQILIGDNIKCYGLDWTPADLVQQEFAAIPKDTNILIAHQVWRDLMGPRIGDAECSFADVPNVEMIVTGDYHRHLKMKSHNRDCRAIDILSPGPVCMQSIDEDPRKYFFLLTDELRVHSVELRTRQCFRFIINTKEELEIFLANNVSAACSPQLQVPEAIAKNIIHIKYLDNIPEAYGRIVSAIGNKAHVFLVPIRHQPMEVTIDIEKRRALADGGLEACLELVTPRDGPLYSSVMSLLQSKNPQESLEALREAFDKNYGALP